MIRRGGTGDFRRAYFEAPGWALVVERFGGGTLSPRCPTFTYYLHLERGMEGEVIRISRLEAAKLVALFRLRSA